MGLKDRAETTGRSAKRWISRRLDGFVRDSCATTGKVPRVGRATAGCKCLMCERIREDIRHYRKLKKQNNQSQP